MIDQPFTPSSIYDAPSVLLEQLLSGELSGESAWQTMFSPSRLSMLERRGVADRVKAASGNNMIVNTMADLATNPFVWMLALSGPAGEVAIKAGRPIFDVAKKLSPWISKNAQTAKLMGMATASSALEGSPMVQLLGDVLKGTQETQAAFRSRVAPPLEKYLKDRGVSHLSVERLASADKETAARVAEDMAVLHASLEGRDRFILNPYIDKESSQYVVRHQLETPWTTTEALNREVSRRGLGDLRQALRESYHEIGSKLFLKEGAEGIVVDPDKIQRILRYEEGKTWLEGDAVTSKYLKQFLGGPDMRGIDPTDPAASGLIGQVIKKQFEEGVYVPRNISEFRGATAGAGRSGRPSVGGLIEPDPSAVLRSGAVAHYAPEDMNAFLRAMGPDSVTPEFAQRFADGQALVQKAAAEGKVVRMLRADPIRSAREYVDGAASTYAMHIQDVSSDSKFWHDHYLPTADLDKWAVTEGVSKGVFKPGIDRLPTETYKVTVPDQYPGSKMPLTQKVGTAPAEWHPRGGFSYADMIRANFSLMKDQYDRDLVTKVLIPSVTGGMQNPHRVTGALLENLVKRPMHALANSAAGKALEESGGLSAKFVQYMRAQSDPEFGLGAHEAIQGVTSYLYTTHQGINLSCAVNNATQPLSLAATWLGAENVLKGYSAGIRELGTYLETRVRKYGIRPITGVERAGLAKSSFKYADLADIGPGILEQIDSAVLKTGQAVQTEKITDRMSHYMMGIFTWAEWLNRSVTAHAVEAAYKKLGRVAEGPMFRKDVMDTVQRTQFSSTPFNRPIAFMTPDTTVGGKAAGLLSHPWVRQYFSYPARMLHGLLSEGGRVGGQEEHWRGVMNTFGRAMGMSAVVYEVGKNVLHNDMSPLLFAANITDLLPYSQGGQMDKRQGALPVPPVIDIPSSLILGLATDDREILSHTLPRLVPGGIAIARALGVAPKLPDIPGVGLLQRTWADWGNIQSDGRVPIYKWDGSLIDTRSVPAMVLKGIGADLGRWQVPGELEKFLIDNRDEFVQHQRDYMNSVLAGDIGTAQNVAGQFEKKFGVPLTVTKGQLKNAIQMRTVPRVERIAARMSPAVRDQYQQLVGISRPNQATALDTPKVGSNLQLTAEQQMELQSRMEQYRVGPAATQESSSGFTSYSSY